MLLLPVFLLLPLSAHAQDPAVEQAARWAHEFAVTLNYSDPIGVSVQRGPFFGDKWAYVTKSPYGGCSARFTAEAIRERVVVAHEVAHCVLDASRLTFDGYAWAVSDAEVAFMEERAKAVAVWLTDDSALGIFRRLQRAYPAEWGIR